MIELAASANPSEITTAAIAKHMQLTQGAIFRHFPNKDAIWKAVMNWVSKTLMARVERATHEAGSPLAALQAIFLTHIDFVTKHPGAPRLLFGESQANRAPPAKQMAQTLMTHYAAHLRNLIELGKASGELRPDLDTEAAVLSFVGSIQGLVMQTLISGDLEQTRQNAPRVFSVFRMGIEQVSKNT